MKDRLTFLLLPSSFVLLPYSVEIEIPGGFGDGFVACLTERFLEALRERVAARLLGRYRLLEQRFAARGLLGEDTLRVGQLGTIRADRLRVADDPAQVRVEHQGRMAAGARGFELGLQCHDRLPDRSAVLLLLSPRERDGLAGRV